MDRKMPTMNNGKWHVGQHVTVRALGGTEYPGTLLRESSPNRFDVRLDGTGQVLEGIRRAFINRH